MNYTYRPKGICAGSISFELDGDIVKNIRFEGGCNGNTQGIAALAEGMKVSEIEEKLSGICCGYKGTSCPDQLAKAVMEAYESD